MKMVEYMKKSFGDMLLSNYIDGDLNRQQLPSPEVYHNIQATCFSCSKPLC